MLNQCVLAVPFHGEKMDNAFNLRVTRENFAEFYDILIIQDEIKNILIEEIYFDSFDLATGKLKQDEIFSVRNNKFEPGIFNYIKKKNSQIFKEPEGYEGHEGFEKIEEYTGGIYNIQLSNKNSGQKKQDTKMIARLYSMQETHKKTISDFRKKLEKANNIIKTGKNFDNAKKILLELEENNNPINLSNIAKLYLKMNEFQKAGELLEQAKNLSPNDFKILYTYAICLYKNNKFDLAEENLIKITEIKPNFMYAHYNLGNIYYKEKKYHKAIDSFKKAMELNPKKADTYFNIALTLEMLDYKELAEKFYSKCLELNPKDKEALKAIKKIAPH